MSAQQRTSPPESDQHSDRTAETEEELRWRRHCLGLAIFLWAFPLCVSWGLVIFSLGDLEFLGFWGIMHAGPLLSVFSGNVSNSQLLISTILSDAAFLITVVMIYRYQAFRLGAPLLFALIGWYFWAGYDFVKHLHIA
ncbi:hypothetical protein Pan153_09890 [Gimesia panareensis]|uniref:Uncharacterized protein n=1 Tax=Gimesia panareensis TaxID=2527978 RepID=A0A518FJ36_9PLAN|nr:hypothetical protein [Gimesia panareensis]QDV16362.1 hypothetical protein Pan153_09890 [Gimesia panareensis]